MKRVIARREGAGRAIQALAGIAVLFAVLPAAGQSGSVELVLTEQGRPVSGALVVLQRLKDAECAKSFKNRNPPPRDIARMRACMSDLPDAATDANGSYTYQQLSPGWYDIRSLWRMQKPPAPGSAIACLGEDWGAFYEPGRDRTGKYDAMIQGWPFELKEGEARQISFDYRNQFEAAKCEHRLVDVKSPSSTGPARIAIPGVRGALELDPGETAWQTTLTQVPFAASPEKCRDERWRKERDALRSHDVDLGRITKITENDVARVEFFIDRSPGGKLEMQDVHAYMGSGDLCAEVHLSKVFYRAEERKLFDEVLSTVRFLPEETAAPLKPR
jgi:hypothetical protein